VAEQLAATLTAVGRPTVVLENVHVTYRVFEDRRPSVRDLVGAGFRRKHKEIHAVRGVSMEAHRGESIGVIGGNGAGKSTLFKAIAGLIPPSQGRVLASSQPSLLGVNAALQPSASGRRNVELGCLALGMTSDQVEEEMERIIAFTGLQDHMDLPLRTYSTGMKARLAFAVATSVQPEILLLDEALSVGDSVFKRRSRERIEQLRENAGTVFVVSHSLRQVGRLCDRVVWFEQGQVVQDGESGEVLEAYRKAKDDEDE
jgi:teichoic acid transport system ATP-binding protein